MIRAPPAQKSKLKFFCRRLRSLNEICFGHPKSGHCKTNTHACVDFEFISASAKTCSLDTLPQFCVQLVESAGAGAARAVTPHGAGDDDSRKVKMSSPKLENRGLIKGRSHFKMIMFFTGSVNKSSYSVAVPIKDLGRKFDYGKLGRDPAEPHKDVIVTSFAQHPAFSY